MDYEKMWKELEETLKKRKESDDSYSVIAYQLLNLMSEIQKRNEAKAPTQ
jgi:hypothetical protein